MKSTMTLSFLVQKISSQGLGENDRTSLSSADPLVSTVFPPDIIREGVGEVTVARGTVHDITVVKEYLVEWMAPIRVPKMIDNGNGRVGGDLCVSGFRPFTDCPIEGMDNIHGLLESQYTININSSQDVV